MSTCTYISRSKRRYPERICKNKNCNHGKRYIPTDFRQEYCCPSCGEDAGNDRRRELNNSTFQHEKQLRLIDKKLSVLFNKYEINGYCQLQKNLLQHEVIDISLGVQQGINTLTKQKVNWLYEYGTEQHPENKDWIIIHKKPK